MTPIRMWRAVGPSTLGVVPAMAVPKAPTAAGGGGSMPTGFRTSVRGARCGGHPGWTAPARPAAPSRTIHPPYSHWTAWPSAHLHPNRSSLDVPTRTTPPTTARTWPCAWPALPHRHPSCPTAPQTGTSRTILHPRQCITSPPQPVLRLLAPPLFGAALVHACLCTSLHRCIPRTAPLSVRSAASCCSA